MIDQVFKMSFDYRHSLRTIFSITRFSLYGSASRSSYGNGTTRAAAYAGAKAVAEQIAYQSSLAFNEAKSAFGAVRYAKTAAVAFRIVYIYNFSFHIIAPLLKSTIGLFSGHHCFNILLNFACRFNIKIFNKDFCNSWR